MTNPIDNRQSSEQLDATIQEVLNEPIPDSIDETKAPAEPENEPENEPAPPETPAETPPEAPEGKEKVTTITDGVDYKEKFKASTREALVQKFKNDQLTEKIDEAANLPEPTEEEMKIYAMKSKANWDDLDDFAKSVLKREYINSKRFELIHEASQAGKELEAWEKQVDGYITATETVAKYPDLDEYEADFKTFCMKRSRRGMDLEDLMASFLFHREQETPTIKKKNKAVLLEGSGGAEAPKPTKISADQVKSLRQRNEKEYQRLVREGKIGIDILEAE